MMQLGVFRFSLSRFLLGAFIQLVMFVSPHAFGAPLIQHWNVNFGNTPLERSVFVEISFQSNQYAVTQFVMPVVQTGSSDYTIRNDGCSYASIPRGSSCFFEVVFKPTSTGEKLGEVVYAWYGTYQEPTSPEPSSSSGEVHYHLRGVGVLPVELPKTDSENSCKVPTNSYVNIDNLALNEALPIVGAGFQLHYSSDRFRESSRFQPKSLGLGGWTPTNVHYYNASEGALYMGDGGFKRVQVPGGSSGAMVPSTDASEMYIFDANGRHIQTLDSVTGLLIARMTYASDGRLTSISDRFNNVVTMASHSGGVTLTSPYGQATVLSFDSDGLLASIENPNGEKHQITYDQRGFLTTFQLPMGQTSSVSYDEYGYVTEDMGAGGDRLTLGRTYDSATGIQTVTSTSAMGVATSYQTSVNGTLSEHVVLHSDGGQSKSVHIDNGPKASADRYGSLYQSNMSPDPRFYWLAPYAQRSSSKIGSSDIELISSVQKTADLQDQNDPLSFQTLETVITLQDDPTRTYRSTYSAAAKKWTMLSPVGRVQTTQLNQAGLPASLANGTLVSSELRYDSRGRLIQISRGARQQLISYDASSNVSKVVDPLGRETRFIYDQAGRVTKTTLPDGGSVAYGYDKNGNLTSITPPGRSAHLFSYNLFDLAQSYLPPILSSQVTGATNHEYTPDKKIFRTTLPNGLQINYSYDSVTGQLTSIHAPSGDYSYQYYPRSPLVQNIRSPYGLESWFTYLGDNLATVSDFTGHHLSISYGSDMSISSMKLDGPSGSSSLDFAYDKDQLLTAVGSISFTRDANGNITRSVHKNIVHEYRYNEFGEMIEDRVSLNKNGKLGTLQELKMSRDALGRVTSMSRSYFEPKRSLRLKTEARRFGYDSRGRLTQVSDDRRTLRTYRYDANGNRVQTQSALGTVKAIYDGQDRLTQYGDAEYEHNEMGQRISRSEPEPCFKNGLLSLLFGKFKCKSITRYIYDAYGQLFQVELPSRDIIQYKYDGLGRRVLKLKNGRITRRWIYASQTQLLAELDGQGKVVKRFIYGTRSNSPDSLEINGREYHLISDHLGTPRLVVDATTGSVIDWMSHDEWGDDESLRGKLSDLGLDDLLRAPDRRSVEIGFAGGVYDPDTQLVHFGARDYDPETGRWTSKDPILFAGGDTNLYGYVLQDPVNFIDPAGLARCSYSISTGRLSCTSNDGSRTGSANMFSGQGKDRNNPGATGNFGGPIPVGNYDITKLPGSNPRDWFLDPGLMSRIGYRLGSNRGGFNLHLRKGGSLGCVTGGKDESDTNFSNINDILNGDAGDNSLSVGF